MHTTSCFLFITTWLPPLKGLPEVNLERFVLGFQNNLLLSYPRCVENTQIFKGNITLYNFVNMLATLHHCILGKIGVKLYINHRLMLIPNFCICLLKTNTKVGDKHESTSIIVRASK